MAARRYVGVFLKLACRSIAIVAMANSLANAQAPAAKTSGAMDKGVLILESDRAGNLLIDGAYHSKLQSDKTVQITLTAGQHILVLRSTGGQTLWKELVNIPTRQQVVRQIQLKNATLPPQTQPSQSAAAKVPSAFELCYLDRKKESLEASVSVSIFECMDNDVNKAESNALRCLAYRLDDPALKELDRLRKETETMCLPEIVARDLYAAGRYVDALRYIGLGRKSTWDDYRGAGEAQPGAYLWFGSYSDIYSLRGRIKHALGDFSGAIDDLAQAEGWYGVSVVNRQKELGLTAQTEPLSGRLEANKRARFRIWRAIVLRDMGRASDARMELITAIESSLDEAKMAELVLKTLPSVSASTPSGRPSSLAQEIQETERSGRTVPLPSDTPCRADPTLSVGTASYAVRNSTPYPLRFVFSGPTEQEVRIQPNASRIVSFPSGGYRILWSVEASGVLPFFGQRVFASGTACASEFFIERKN